MNGFKLLVIGVLLICFASCDVGFNMYVNEMPEMFIQTECGNISLTSSTFGSDRISFKLDGDFNINISSLKLSYEYGNEDLKFLDIYIDGNKYSVLNGDSGIVNLHGHNELSVSACRYLPLKYGRNPTKMRLLPSDFITCNGESVITDTISCQIPKDLKLPWWYF